MAKKEKPIYQYIKEHVKDGVLPEQFRLPEDKNSDMDFAPGAKDGIYIFHIPKIENSDDEKDNFHELIDAISDARFEQAENMIKLITKEKRVLSIMADIQEYVAEEIDNLNDENLFNFSCYLIENATDIESVKFGLGLVLLFECKDEGFKDTIRTLGLSDEFTLYSAINMMMWSFGNEEIFELAKKVHGWGRIHIVDRLLPERKEIIDWLFYEGIDNSIMPQYSAFPCWYKGECDKRIKETMTRKDFDAVSKIVDAMLDDEPVPGFSNLLSNAFTPLKDFLARAAEQELNDDDKKLIEKIRDYAKDEEHQVAKIVPLCDDLLNK